MLTKAQLLPRWSKQVKIKNTYFFFGGDLIICMYPAPSYLTFRHYLWVPPPPTSSVMSFLNGPLKNFFDNYRKK